MSNFCHKKGKYIRELSLTPSGRQVVHALALTWLYMYTDCCIKCLHGFYNFSSRDFRCLALVKYKQGKSHDVKTKVPVNYRLAWKNSVIHSQKGFDINSVFISHDTSARSNKLIKFHSIWPEIWNDDTALKIQVSFLLLTVMGIPRLYVCNICKQMHNFVGLGLS